MVKKKNSNESNVETKQFYDKVISSSAFMDLLSGKSKIRVATAMVYERVGDSEIFLGGYPLLKGKFDVGEYVVLNVDGKPYFMDYPDSSVFIPCKDRKLNKIIEVVKNSDDDYRFRSKLNTGFYHDDKVPIMVEEEVIQDGERIIDENGKPYTVRVQSKDDDGKLLFETKKVFYSEPKGVTQEGRNAIRNHNKTKQKINEFRNQNKGFFEKYGGIIVPVVGLAVVAMVFLMGMKFIGDSWSEGVNSLTGEIKDASKDIRWWQSPEALDVIAGAVQEKTDEKNAPPVK